MIWDLRFLHLASVVASWGKDPSTKCGAVVVDSDRNVVSVGYNGFPRAMVDHPGHLADRAEKYPRTIHAEINAILAARQSLSGCTLYTYPMMTCDRCAVHVIQSGIVRVVAPDAPTDKADRWGGAFASAVRYYSECGVELVIVPRDRLEAHLQREPD